MTADSKILATYTEHLLEVSREFELYDDRVVVRAQWLLKGDFEHVVKLASLTGDIVEVQIRYRLYRYAGWAAAVSGLVFAAAYYSAGGSVLGILGYFSMSLALLSAIVMAMAYPNRRIRFARFNSAAGRPALDIGCAGNSAAVFESFVDQVRSRISKKRRPDAPAREGF